VKFSIVSRRGWGTSLVALGDAEQRAALDYKRQWHCRIEGELTLVTTWVSGSMLTKHVSEQCKGRTKLRIMVSGSEREAAGLFRKARTYKYVRTQL
jgi:hypothetical protein